MPTNKRAKPTLPKIYIFSKRAVGDTLCRAVAEDGTELASHVCSGEGFVPLDLGAFSSHAGAYEKHYPRGYKIEHVLASRVKSHKALATALATAAAQ